MDNGLEVSYINNELNDLFDMNIIFDMGSDNDKKLGLAAGYMEYLGTDKYSAEELKKEFYKLGVKLLRKRWCRNNLCWFKWFKRKLTKRIRVT